MKWYIIALIAFLVILLGLFISANALFIFSGVSFEGAALIASTLYLSGVVAACTYIIVSKLKK